MPSTRKIRSLSKDIETFTIPKENNMANQENATPEVPEVPEAIQGAPEAPEASIGLNDLQLLRQIVDLATQRGAFRGAELTQVGAVFDKLAGFLDQMIAALEEAESHVDIWRQYAE